MSGGLRGAVEGVVSGVHEAVTTVIQFADTSVDCGYQGNDQVIPFVFLQFKQTSIGEFPLESAIGGAGEDDERGGDLIFRVVDGLVTKGDNRRLVGQAGIQLVVDRRVGERNVFSEGGTVPVMVQVMFSPTRGTAGPTTVLTGDSMSWFFG